MMEETIVQKKLIVSVIIILAFIINYFLDSDKQLSNTTSTKPVSEESYNVVINFPSEKYPETADHIEDAITDGNSKICTIDRNGADENRDESLKNIPTKVGYDRDEYPMAMCEEGGAGADIEYITPSDNRGAGSWVSHQLSDYPDGTKVLFVVE